MSSEKENFSPVQPFQFGKRIEMAKNSDGELEIWRTNMDDLGVIMGEQKIIDGVPYRKVKVFDTNPENKQMVDIGAGGFIDVGPNPTEEFIPESTIEKFVKRLEELYESDHGMSDDDPACWLAPGEKMNLRTTGGLDTSEVIVQKNVTGKRNN